jgi:uncharacterized protein YccT (UPF0319 family)
LWPNSKYLRPNYPASIHIDRPIYRNRHSGSEATQVPKYRLTQDRNKPITYIVDGPKHKQFGIATVDAHGVTTVYAHGIATVYAHGIATVDAHGIATVNAHGIATVYAHGVTTVYARS